MDKDKKLKPFEVRSYCKKQLMQFYDIKIDLLNAWMEAIKDELGKKLGRDYTPRQVLIILKNCGVPQGYYLTEETLDAIAHL